MRIGWDIRHIPELTDEEFKWKLQRLFPYPEDMGPFLVDRYKIFVTTIDANLVTVNPMSDPSNDVFYLGS